jgi:hypothetical protein
VKKGRGGKVSLWGRGALTPLEIGGKYAVSMTGEGTRPTAQIAKAGAKIRMATRENHKRQSPNPKEIQKDNAPSAGIGIF